MEGSFSPSDPRVSHGHETSTPPHPHGPYVSSAAWFRESFRAADDTTLRRSSKSNCACSAPTGAMNRSHKTSSCNGARVLHFAMNIKVNADLIPAWMRRKRPIFPHPSRTVRDVNKCKSGKRYLTGRPSVGTVYVAGIKMRCSAVRQLCCIRYKGVKYYAHKSVVFT